MDLPGEERFIENETGCGINLTPEICPLCGYNWLDFMRTIDKKPNFEQLWDIQDEILALTLEQSKCCGVPLRRLEEVLNKTVNG